jgi:hypothetical protein
MMLPNEAAPACPRALTPAAGSSVPPWYNARHEQSKYF